MAAAMEVADSPATVATVREVEEKAGRAAAVTAGAGAGATAVGPKAAAASAAAVAAAATMGAEAAFADLQWAFPEET